MGVWNLVSKSDVSKPVIAICSFIHDNVNTLKFKIGERLEVVEECQEWYRGYLVSDPSKLGIFPKSYVKTYSREDLIHPDVTEIESILREWTSVWYNKYEECEKRKIIPSLTGYFMNLLTLKNMIVGDRSSIDEVKDKKKTTASQILKGNSLLGLDVIAYDSNFDRLDASRSTTVFLYEELKKNNNISKQTVIPMPPAITFDDSMIDINRISSSAVVQSSSYTTFCLKLSIEKLVSNQTGFQFSENSILCVNLFILKENITDSYYLCENAFFPISRIIDQDRNNSDSTLNALFCDISEKDFELTRGKNGYKLLFIAHIFRQLKTNPHDRHSSISRVYAGGVCDLGANLCNLIYVASEHSRHIQSSMALNVNEYFETSVVTAKNIQESLNLKDLNDSFRSQRGNITNSKETFINFTFRCELVEATYKKAKDQFLNLKPCICRKMNFPEIIMPDDFRNDFYVTVVGGDFQKARNYEFVVNLVQFKSLNGAGPEEVPVDLCEDSDGVDEQDLARRIFFYKSIVYAKQEKPKWNEIVNVSIPHGKRLEEIKKTYLRFVIRNRPLSDDKKDKTKIFGRCYLQITNEDGSAIQDNHLFLPVTKLESDADVITTDSTFIRLRTPLSIQKHSQMAQPYTNADKLKDFLEINVKVVSTQLTQNVTLLNLLSFATEPKPTTDKYKQLLTYLNELLSVKDQQSAEIVKFLQAIMDKLIDIFLDLSAQDESYDIHSRQIQPCVFDILVAIFQIIENQSKFASFRTVIDAYLSKNFCVTLAHGPLLRLFLTIMSRVYANYTTQLDGVCSFPKLTTKPGIQTGRISFGTGSNAGASIESFGYLDDANGVAGSGEDWFEFALNTTKSMEYIFKFAFRSRELLAQCYRSNSQQLRDDTFDNDVELIFTQLTQITLINQPVADTFNSPHMANLVKLQSFVLKYSISLMPILIDSKRYTTQRISQLYMGFLQSRFVLQTQFLSKLIKSQLFECPEARLILMPPLCTTISNLLTIDPAYDEKKNGPLETRLESIGRVLSELMDVLEAQKNVSIKDNVNEISKIFGRILNAFLYLSSSTKEPRQLFATVVISVIRTMDAAHFTTFFDYTASLISNPLMSTLLAQNQNTSFNRDCSCIIDTEVNNLLVTMKNITPTDSNSQLVLIKLLYTCKVLLSETTIAIDWFDLLILRNSVVLSALINVSVRLDNCHKVSAAESCFSSLDKQIWRDYFECMVVLTVDKCLQLEGFNENKRRKVMDIYGDLRVKAALEIKRMWFNLGDLKQEFILDMVEPFMLVALIPITQIQDTILPIFFDMINCEHLMKREATRTLEFTSFSVPHQLVTSLDAQIGLGRGDSQFKNAFDRIFSENFKGHVYFSQCITWVGKTVELFELLVEYRQIDEADVSDELKTFYLNEILAFYDSMIRYDLYVKYVEVLRRIHKATGNQVCAAHTLQLHAKLLNWSTNRVQEYLEHPCYKVYLHKELKEALFLDIISDFTEGQAWEKALNFSKELRERYESQFELEKLHGFLRKQADLCEKIVKQKRYECNYFLVGFYGRDFPSLLRNRQFVFRSEQLEQISTFMLRIESWFPHAQRISITTPITSSLMNSDKQHIQIINVRPVYDLEKFNDFNVSTQILNYYHHNELNRFKYEFLSEDTNLKAAEEDPSQLSTIAKTWTISETLPNVCNFYPVISETVLHISPVQNALNNLGERMSKLKAAYEQVDRQNKADEVTKSLLLGTVDPGVNGGLPKYMKFMEKEFREISPENQLKSDDVKSAIIELICLADSLLILALTHSPEDQLLSTLESTQLPKLKQLFEIPIQPTLRRKQIKPPDTFQATYRSGNIETTSLSASSTPKITTNLKNSISESIRQMKGNSDSSRNLISYLVGGDKTTLTSQFHISNNQRDSITSLKSITSETDDASSANALTSIRNKIFLEETVNPKRPLRPSKANVNSNGNNITTSSPSASNQSSRPVSHLSGEDGFPMGSSVSMQQISERITDSFNMQEEDDFGSSESGSQIMKPPPPKPPKPTKIKGGFFVSTPSPTVLSERSSTSILNNTSSQSSENIKNSMNSIYDQQEQQQTSQTKSTVSLNGLQRFTGQLKTSSDSVLNRAKDKIQEKLNREKKN